MSQKRRCRQNRGPGCLMWRTILAEQFQSGRTIVKKTDNGKSEEKTNRRKFLQAGALAGAAAAFAPGSGAMMRTSRIEVRENAREGALAGGSGAGADSGGGPNPFAPGGRDEVKAFEFDEVTIAELQDGMKSGKHTARSIAEKYLARIDAIDAHGPEIRSVIETNPDALAIAEALDKERKAKGPRGPLHGIPVLIKDNIDTFDGMMTTAGSLALVGAKPPKDSFVVGRLRQAGALILGKTNPSEWANIRSTHSTSGWSGRGGLTRNPYALNRNPCGSSSGSGAAVSANLCAIAIGTETDGSIVCPSSANGVVGIKPTVGLISRRGIIPISHTQDTAGPMGRTVRDAAILLGAMAGSDPNDKVTTDEKRKALSDYTKALDPHGLKGARIGVARNYFGFDDTVDALMTH